MVRLNGIVSHRFAVPQRGIVKFCEKWSVREFSLFGSVVRDDFRPESDVDVLMSFAPDAPWSFYDLITMRTELEQISGGILTWLKRGVSEIPSADTRSCAIRGSFMPPKDDSAQLSDAHRNDVHCWLYSCFGIH